METTEHALQSGSLSLSLYIYIYIFIWPRVINIVLFNPRLLRSVAHTPWAASGPYPLGSQWPIPLGKPVAHTPGQPVAHTNVSHRGPYPRKRRFSHFGFRLESSLASSGVDLDMSRACPSALGTLLYFLIRAVLLGFIRRSGV